MKTQKTYNLTLTQNRKIRIENQQGRPLITIISSGSRTRHHYQSLFYYLKKEGFLKSDCTFGEVDWAAPSYSNSRHQTPLLPRILRWMLPA